MLYSHYLNPVVDDPNLPPPPPDYCQPLHAPLKFGVGGNDAPSIAVAVVRIPVLVVSNARHANSSGRQSMQTQRLTMLVTNLQSDIFFLFMLYFNFTF